MGLGGGGGSSVLLYLLEKMDMSLTVKDTLDFIHSFQNERSSPSCIAQTFDGFSSISRQSAWVYLGIRYSNDTNNNDHFLYLYIQS
jgi:hypothetical protein